MSVVKVLAQIGKDEFQLGEVLDGNYEGISHAPGESTDILLKAEDEHGNNVSENVKLLVINEWMPPKTDWKSEDYFNFEDYNRIIGNLEYLKILGKKIFYNFPSIQSLGDKKNYESMIYAREINMIEECLEKLNISSYLFYIGEKKTYYPNKNTTTYSEFNRIESSMLLLYKTMISQKKSLKKLSFRLGSKKGIRS